MNASQLRLLSYRGALSGYVGLKLSFVLIGLALSLALLALCWQEGVIAGPSFALSPAWREYLVLFWIAHPVLLLLKLTGFVVVFILDVGRPVVEEWLAPVPPSEDAWKVQRAVSRVLPILGVGCLAFWLALYPLFHLVLPRWMPFVIGVATALVSGLPWYFDVYPLRRRESSGPAGQLRYRSGARFLLGQPFTAAREVTADLNAVAQARAMGLAGPEGDRGNGDRGFVGFQQLVQGLASVMQVSPARVTLFPSADTALLAALTAAREPGWLVVTTDCESEELLADVCLRSPDHVRIVRVRERHLANVLPGPDLQAEFAAEIRRALEEGAPGVVALVSHVLSDTGICLDVGSLGQSFPPARLRVVVNGGTAIGNVAVSPTLLDQVEHYVFRGDRWLNVPRAVGVVIAGASALVTGTKVLRAQRDVVHLDSSPGLFAALADPYAEALVGLASMLKREWLVTGLSPLLERQSALRALFMAHVEKLGIHPVGGGTPTSLVRLRLPEQLDAGRLATWLRKAGAVIYAPDPRSIQLAFRYYLENGRVIWLLDRLAEAKFDQRTHERIMVQPEFDLASHSDALLRQDLADMRQRLASMEGLLHALGARGPSTGGGTQLVAPHSTSEASRDAER